MDQYSDSDDDNDINELADSDEEFLDAPKQHHKYYLGSCKLIRPDNYYLMLSTVSCRTFLQYSASTIQRYIESVSLIYVHTPAIDIMKLEVLPDETYTVLKKTIWIRLVQRRWRSIMRERSRICAKRRTIMARRNFEMTGRWPSGLNVLPGLYGMMGRYSNTPINK
jgi:hypothetical protein